MEAIAVIGGMYGDEGKGLMTDYMCDQMLKKGKKPAVVRFQGGAQSGHTVVTPEGFRHIFSHFGSGTHLGVPTILSSKFVCNPLLFLIEYEEIKGFGPSVYVGNECYISTPFDVNFNQELERSRGKGRHGSVGAGFGETIEREEVGKISLRYKDLYEMGSKQIEDRLHDIREYYIERCGKFNIKRNKVTYDKRAIYLIYQDMMRFRFSTIPLMETLPINIDSLIFEGGQGLGLDMEYGEFPHVTRSKTGIHHALEFCSNFNIRLDGVVYVTRSYTTRHGAGPLYMEDIGYYGHIHDETNKKNEFQGEFRIAPFDFDLFAGLTGEETSIDTFKGFAKYAMTWVDAIPKTLKSKIILAGSLLEMEHYEYVNYINGTFDLVSYGPTRNDVRENY